MINPISAHLDQALGTVNVVRVSALPMPGSPIMLNVCYHDTMQTEEQEEQVSMVGVVRVADTLARIEIDWPNLSTLHEWCLEAAWTTGAGMLKRFEFPPFAKRDRPFARNVSVLPTPNQQRGNFPAFSASRYSISYRGKDQPTVIGDDGADLINYAAEFGYYTWEFEAKKWIAPELERPLPHPSFQTCPFQLEQGHCFELYLDENRQETEQRRKVYLDASRRERRKRHLVW